MAGLDWEFWRSEQNKGHIWNTIFKLEMFGSKKKNPILKINDQRG